MWCFRSVGLMPEHPEKEELLPILGYLSALWFVYIALFFRGLSSSCGFNTESAIEVQVPVYQNLTPGPSSERRDENQIVMSNIFLMLKLGLTSH